MNFFLFRFYRFILHSDSDNKSFHFMFVRWTTSLLPNVKISKNNFIVSRGKHIRKHDTSDSGNDANHLSFCNPYSFDILL